MCTKNVGFGRNLKSPSLDFSHDVTTLAKREQIGGYNKNTMGTSQIYVYYCISIYVIIFV